MSRLLLCPEHGVGDNDKIWCETCGERLYDCFVLSKEEATSLVNEFSHQFINTNDNPLTSQVIQRMIKFVEDK